jgi:proline iminopeptidase
VPRYIVLLLVLTVARSADKSAPKAFTRGQAAAIVANARKIVSPNGIERLQMVRIGAIEQWVSIRGYDKRNPVLLFIHGGPGYVSMPMSWWFSRGWEEYFTVVQWDQRGAGKTYLLNDPAKIAPTLTFIRMQADAEEMVNWIRQHLGKQKIFVIGHSWGSYVGLELAKKHPEWLHAYIGVGQLTNSPESERRGWVFALNAARRAGNTEAVRDLQALAPYFAPGHPSSLQAIYTQQKWLDAYGGVMANRPSNSPESDLAQLSPDYTDEEISRIWQGNSFSEQYLLADVLTIDLTGIATLDCPVIIFAGRHDFNVNSQLAADWFAKVKAPSKHFEWFENSAHLPMSEEPGKFFTDLLRYARPIAARSGDSPPAN